MISQIPCARPTNREGCASLVKVEGEQLVGESPAQCRDRPHRPQLDPSPAAPAHFCQPFSPFFAHITPVTTTRLLSSSAKSSNMVGPRKRGADAEDEEELVALPSDEEEDEEEEE